MVALVLTFWCVHQPRKMGIGHRVVRRAGDGTPETSRSSVNMPSPTAFLAFAAVSLHRRILWFSAWRQAAHVLCCCS